MERRSAAVQWSEYMYHACILRAFSDLFEFYVNFHVLHDRISLTPLLAAKQMQLRLHHHLSFPHFPLAWPLTKHIVEGM
jgi:hypothetical protein